MKNKNFGIYIHIPFCDSKCSYCNFVSGAYDKKVKNSYFKALQNEIISDKFLCKNLTVSSIYFGGGTPSSVETLNILKILKTFKKTFSVKENAEISIECNPCSVDLKKIIAYKKAGFTRISFGAQSFDDEVLKFLNRRHCVTQIFDAVKMSETAGFENVSIDFIIGVKKTNMLNFKQNILKLKELGLKHISVYMLMLETGTKIYSDFQNNIFKPLSDDECVKEYNQITEILKNFGFYRYEVSNFALKNFECKHNQNYWNCGEYLGFGLSSHGFIKNKRIENTSDIFEYINFYSESDKEIGSTQQQEKSIHKKEIDSTQQNKSTYKIGNKESVYKIGKEKSIHKIETLTKSQKIEEYIMLALRTAEGLNFSKLNQLGFDIQKEKETEIKQLVEKELITKTPAGLFVNEKHFGTLNLIILKLIP